MTNKSVSGRGGARAGAGRPKGTKKPIKPESEKAKKYTFWLYQWEVPTVREFVKSLRRNKEENEQRPDIAEKFEKSNKLI